MRTWTRLANCHLPHASTIAAWFPRLLFACTLRLATCPRPVVYAEMDGGGWQTVTCHVQVQLLAVWRLRLVLAYCACGEGRRRLANCHLPHASTIAPWFPRLRFACTLTLAKCPRPVVYVEMDGGGWQTVTCHVQVQFQLGTHACCCWRLDERRRWANCHMCKCNCSLAPTPAF
jgi:hypothetical protein